MSTIKRLSILAVAGIVWCQATAQVSPLARTISVSGTGVTHVKPDFATVDVGAFSKSSSAVEAKRRCDVAMGKAIAAIRKLGVKAEDIETTEYSVFPIRAKADSPIAWKVVETASVKVKDLAVVADVIDTAVANGAPNVSDIRFGLDAVGPARAKARALAVKAATDKAAALAKMLGVEIGDVQTVLEMGGYDQGQAFSNYDSGTMGLIVAPQAISPGQRSVSLTVNVVFAIK